MEMNASCRTVKGQCFVICGRQFLTADSADGGFDMDLGDFQVGPLFHLWVEGS